ncbi:MAG: MFS transporter [Streptosporangiales bacterium]|nr:MFS transporter [Streptosporangiales bacterium]
MLGPVSPQRVGVATALAVIMTVPSLTQFALGSLAPFLTDEFHLTPTAFGAVTASYYLAAAGLSPLMGRWVDHLGTRRALLVTVGIGWVGSLTLAGAPALVGVLASVFVAGAATAMANPATNVAISTLPRPHAALVGVKQSGVQTAALLGGAILPALAVAYGWRTSVLACSVAFAVGVVAAATMPVPARTHVTRTRRKGMRTRPGVRRLALFAGLMGCGMAATNVYLVLYAHDRVHMDVRLAGSLLATVGLVAIIARITLTLVAERARAPERTGMRMLRTMAVVAVGAAALIASAPQLGAGVLWVGAVATGLSVAAFNGVTMFVLIRTSHQTATATDSGLVQGSFFAGMLVSPPVFGLLVDLTGSYTYGWTWAAVCLVAAAIVIPGATALMTPHPEPG